MSLAPRARWPVSLGAALAALALAAPAPAQSLVRMKDFLEKAKNVPGS